MVNRFRVTTLPKLFRISGVLAKLVMLYTTESSTLPMTDRVREIL